jgi:hypothetical protein
MMAAGVPQGFSHKPCTVLTLTILLPPHKHDHHHLPKKKKKIFITNPLRYRKEDELNPVSFFTNRNSSC